MVCSVCGSEMKINYNQETGKLMAKCEKCDYVMPCKDPTYETNASKSENKAEQNAGVLFCRIASAVCGAIALFGVFLPFVKVSFLGFNQEASFFELSSDAKILVGASALGIVFAAFAKYIIPALAGILDVFILYVDTSDYWTKIASDEYGKFAVKGIGYHCMYIGAIGLSVFAIIAIAVTASNKKKRGLEE